MAPLFDADFRRALDTLALMVRKHLAGRERARPRAGHRGGIVEFSGHRRYARGDELRYVDWNVYARHGSLFVKEFASEGEVRTLVLLDRSGSMDCGGGKWDDARRIAAAVAYVALATWDTIGFYTFSTTVEELRGRGRGDIFDLLETLEQARPEGETSMVACARHPFPRAKGRTAAVFVTDFYDIDGWKDALKRMSAAGFEVSAIHPVAAEELAPPARGRARLVDSETGRAREVALTDRDLERYARVFHGHLEEIETFCNRHEIGYARVPVGAPLERVFLTLLSKGIVFRAW